jgi:hypothetical protein
MNKESGASFKSTIPAELSYCEEIESWVFRHPRIRTSLDYEEANECDWLLRSEQTEQFSIEEVSNDFWYLWRGRIEDEYRVNINCAEVRKLSPLSRLSCEICQCLSTLTNDKPADYHSCSVPMMLTVTTSENVYINLD